MPKARKFLRGLAWIFGLTALLLVVAFLVFIDRLQDHPPKNCR